MYWLRAEIKPPGAGASSDSSNIGSTVCIFAQERFAGTEDIFRSAWFRSTDCVVLVSGALGRTIAGRVTTRCGGVCSDLRRAYPITSGSDPCLRIWKESNLAAHRKDNTLLDPANSSSRVIALFPSNQPSSATVRDLEPRVVHPKEVVAIPSNHLSLVVLLQLLLALPLWCILIVTKKTNHPLHRTIV